MILFSTHRFDMVEQLCSRVVILSAGRIVRATASPTSAGGPARSRRSSCARPSSPTTRRSPKRSSTRFREHDLRDRPFSCSPVTSSRLFDFGFLSDAGAARSSALMIGIALVFFGRAAAAPRVHFEIRRARRRRRRALLKKLADHAFLIGVPMWIVAVVAFVGHALFPDETDFRVLMALPLTRLVFTAKLAAWRCSPACSSSHPICAAAAGC